MAGSEQSAAWVPERKNGKGTTRLLVGIIAFVVIVAALRTGRDIIIPLALAALASCGLEPFNKRLVRLGLPRALSASVVVGGVVLGLVAGGWALQGPASKFIERLPSLTQRLRSALDHGGLTSTVAPVQEAANELKKAADGSGTPASRGVARVQVEQPPTRLTDVLWQGTVSVFQVVVQTSMVVFLVFYLLASGDRYREKIIEIAGPSMFRRHLTVEILRRIIEQVERFLMARLLISVIVGVATGGALSLLGMSQALIWGLVAGVLNNIPYIGPTAAVAGIALAALVQFGRMEMVGAAAGVATLIAMIEGFALTPWMMGRAGKMNTGVVFVSLMFWGWVWGIWGILLAVPIMMAIKAICDQVDVLRPVGELLSE